MNHTMFNVRKHIYIYSTDLAHPFPLLYIYNTLIICHSLFAAVYSSILRVAVNQNTCIPDLLLFVPEKQGTK